MAQRVAVTMTRAEKLEFARAAQAMYFRGQNDLGHLLSGVASVRDGVQIRPDVYDEAAKAYRAWLVFDEPKAQA